MKNTKKELRRGEILWGAKPDIKIIRFWPTDGGGRKILAYLDIETASGFVVSDIKLMDAISGNRYWLAMPSIKQVGKDGSAIIKDGKAVYREIVSFRDRSVRDRFCNTVLEAIRRHYPQVLRGVE